MTTSPLPNVTVSRMEKAVRNIKPNKVEGQDQVNAKEIRGGVDSVKVLRN